ncbi:MAG: hypothetical protein ABIK12_10765 [Pseudomonadota bacterium]
MFCKLTPRFGRDYWVGDVGFFRQPGAFLSHNISMDTYRDMVLAGELVASHTGVIVSETHLVEATTPVVRRWPLAEYFRDPETLLWIKRPLGQTRASGEAMGRFAAGVVGQPYDVSAIIGLMLSDEDDKGQEPNPLADVGEWICSRLVDVALHATEAARTVPLPAAFKRVHPTLRTPQGLNGAPIWEPAITGPPPA